jgi:hypothetical protein
MKRQLVVALGLAVVSVPALASKARLQALGEDVNGSQYLSDNRNIFLNAAHVNLHKDIVTFESGDASATDATTTPNAEGGFLRAQGNLVYGVHFGHQHADLIAARNEASTNLPTSMNSWDFFIGGDAGMQWGAALSYATFTNEQVTNEIKASSIGAKVGVISGNTEGFLNLSLQNTAEEDTVADFKVKSAYDVGVNHNIHGGTVMVRISSLTAEESKAGTEDYTVNSMSLGYGRVQKLNDKANLNYKLAYMTSKESTNYTSDKEDKTMAVMATIGVEANVKEWLVLRGSIAQALLGEEENTNGDKKSIADSTVVNAGASLVFGDFQIDGVIGNADSSGVAGDNTSSGNGTLRTDTFMSRVSATYRF